MAFTVEKIIEAAREIDAVALTEEKETLAQAIGEMFAQFRFEHNLSQRAAAEKLGTTQSHISSIEKGGWDLKMSTMLKYASAYGYNVEIGFVPKGQEVDIKL